MAAAVFSLDAHFMVADRLFAFLAALLAVAFLSTYAKAAPRLALERKLPRFATAGEPFAYRLTVTNNGRRAEPLLAYEELIAEQSLSFEAFRQAANSPDFGLFERPSSVRDGRVCDHSGSG